ncbi:MAG: membrane-bound lytic murein transglycosylase C [bacterium]|nr:MAG: membrane-bound lytic murein transglycosylase C [bacterium]
MKIFNRFYLLTLVMLLIVSLSLPLSAEAGPDSAFDELNKETEHSQTNSNQMDMQQLQKAQEKERETLRQNMEKQDKEWGRLSRKMEVQWNQMVKRVNAQREELRKRVEQQWDEFQDSTNKEWVEYNPGMDTRSRVDFETGEVEISTLIPVEELKDKGEPVVPESGKLNESQQKKVRKLAEKKIEKQMKEILSSDNEVHTDALKDQIKDPEGKTITQKNSREYVEKYVAPEMKIEKKPVVAKDGIPRIKVTVKLKMVPEHLRIRAEKYKGQVNKYAKEYDLDPALIYAVIQTESYFNPLAKSYIPAYGLMQLVPKSGAMDAYYYLYKEKKILPSGYLYNPDNNVMLGATYLHILQSIYLADIKDRLNRQTLSIAAYNWGPGRIKNKIVKKNKMNRLSNAEVLELINKRAPRETRDYVRKVQERMKLYGKM